MLVPGRMQPMAKLVYLAAAFFLAAPVALLIALASNTIYPYYDTTPHLFGLSPRDDQQLGGILMAVEQSVILFVVFSLAFYELLADDERRPDDARFHLMDRVTAACVQFSASRDKSENIARMAHAGRGGRRPRRPPGAAAREVERHRRRPRAARLRRVARGRRRDPRRVVRLGARACSST